jgi:hypothetical protein
MAFSNACSSPSTPPAVSLPPPRLVVAPLSSKRSSVNPRPNSRTVPPGVELFPKSP